MVGIAMLTSCNKEDLDIKYQLTATIDIINVVKNIKDIANADLFPNGAVSETEKVRISIFVYNKAGELVIEESQLVNNFSEKLTLNKEIKEGVYSIIVCADVVDAENGTKIDKEYWQFDQTSLLQNSKVNFTNGMAYYTMVLGYTKQEITIKKSQDLLIDVKPTGSMVTLDFDYLNLSKIQTIEVGYKTWNDYLSLSDGNTSTKELLNSGKIYTLTKGEYRNLVKSTYIFPSDKLTIIWDGLDLNGNVVISGTIPSTSLTAGVNKIITIDTSTGNVTTTTKSAKIPDGTSGIRVQSIETEKMNLSH